MRHFLGEKTTRLFLEPSLAYNLVTRGTQNVASGGLAIGIDHALTNAISIGGTAGLEFFGTDLQFANYAKVGDVRFTPKVLISTSIHL